MRLHRFLRGSSAARLAAEEDMKMGTGEALGILYARRNAKRVAAGYPALDYPSTSLPAHRLTAHGWEARTRVLVGLWAHPTNLIELNTARAAQRHGYSLAGPCPDWDCGIPIMTKAEIVSAFEAGADGPWLECEPYTQEGRKWVAEKRWETIPEGVLPIPREWAQFRNSSQKGWMVLAKSREKAWLHRQWVEEEAEIQAWLGLA